MHRGDPPLGRFETQEAASTGRAPIQSSSTWRLHPSTSAWFSQPRVSCDRRRVVASARHRRPHRQSAGPEAQFSYGKWKHGPDGEVLEEADASPLAIFPRPNASSALTICEP